MDKIRKQKLLNYLFPREEIVEFMFCDFYSELALVLDKKICFSSKNLNNETRRQNLELSKNIVIKFLQENDIYLKRLLEYYPDGNFKVLVSNIICGYTLIISSHINRGSGADVFLDKRSVFFSKNSILDLL